MYVNGGSCGDFGHSGVSLEVTVTIGRTAAGQAA